MRFTHVTSSSKSEQQKKVERGRTRQEEGKARGSSLFLEGTIVCGSKVFTQLGVGRTDWGKERSGRPVCPSATSSEQREGGGRRVNSRQKIPDSTPTGDEEGWNPRKKDFCVYLGEEGLTLLSGLGEIKESGEPDSGLASTTWLG